MKEYSLRPVESGHSPVFQIDYEKELNPAQFEAVTSLQGPMLCIAGAGTGKTRTLTYRVARMIETGILPSSILLLTFTRKAANNMLSRVVSLVGDRGSNVAGGTYHSFANSILRQYGYLIGLPAKFSILDEGDSCDVLNLGRTELGMNKTDTRFPRKSTLKEILSKTTNWNCRLEEVILREFSHFIEHLENIEKVFDHYRAYKEKNHMLDYDDLLVFLHKLLSESEEARDKLSNRFRYLLVDEYQDTNILQAKITELIGRKHRNVMIVGDDAQSIYSFRGANFRNIRDFPSMFPEARIVKLEENYRSTTPILDASNHLMTRATERFEKNLFSRREGGEKPGLVPCADEEEQSAFVAQRVLELREEGVPLSGCAVLFRSGYHAFQLEIELKRRNIPFVKWGGFKFLEAAHIKDILAHFRILYNPEDKVSWQRALLLVEGVGTKSFPVIFEATRKASNPFDLSSIDSPPRMKEGLNRLGAMLVNASSSEAPKPQSLFNLIADYYIPILKNAYDDYPRRLRDIDQLSVICGRYDSLAELLADFAIEPPTNSIDGVLKVDDDDEDHLILSTVHSAKGLEWHSVFVIWALEGRFPGFSSCKTPEAVDEERRLMYVAMTRARENLYLTFPVRFWDPINGQLLTRPSRFIEETGDQFFEKWRLSR